MSYRVELPVFSGPMDLLLHLVRQQEVDIHEIKLARILEDYLKHLTILQQLDLQDIGDFVVMASTLMEIKSRDLLPSEAVEIEQELDPRDDLIQRLLEYKRYRDLARQLEGRAELRSRQAPLVLSTPSQLGEAEDEDLLDLGNVGLFDLTTAFAKLLEEIGAQSTMQIEVEKRDVGYYTRRLLDGFRQRREVPFSAVFDRTEGRYGLIGTLIALLEMMKQGYLRAHQEHCFDEIQLAFRGDDSVTADQILAGITAEEQRQEARAAEAAAANFAEAQRPFGATDAKPAATGAAQGADEPEDLSAWDELLDAADAEAAAGEPADEVDEVPTFAPPPEEAGEADGAS
ncbi:MAG: segregation/condensation protein A [Planctomycetes bacterium]|nr:segregation/condensation protein A [Planctomycetota bacterium]